VIARISSHALRLEREFQLCRSFKQTSDPDCKHTVRPLELVRLPSLPAHNEPMVVSLFESPGRNYLVDLVDFGQAWLRGRDPRTLGRPGPEPSTSPHDQVSLLTFLDFAVGATECLELLHHGLRVVHGELRADAFHFSQHTRVVKLVNFGSGPRSFENGLTSAGWSKLSRELGIKNKLQFIAPEQTGRLSGNPDSRSDIYSLGVLLWTMLIGEPAFDGDAPIDVIQAVLNRRLPSVSSKRMDVPDVLSNIIQKMTLKQIDERYSSTSGLKHDFVKLQRTLAEGDGEALLNFQLGSRDVSSIFMLPPGIYGGGEDHEKIVAVIDKVAKVQPVSLDRNGGSGIYSMVSESASTISGRFDNAEEGVRSSSVSSYDQASNMNANSVVITNGACRLPQSHISGRKDSNQSSIEKPALETTDSRHSVETTFSVNSYASTAGPSASQRNEQLALSTRPKVGRRYKKRSRCEVVIISGSAGLGKSSLLQNVQSDIRSRSGYSAIAKFEREKSNPFESVFRSVGSLFRQIFSESDINSDYYNLIRRQLRPIWPSLCSMMDLPVDLISSEALEAGRPSRFAANSSLSHDGSSSVGKHSGRNASTSNGLLSTTDATRTNATSRSLKIISSIAEVLRVLSTNRLICLCLDDLQYAEGESLELLSSVVARKLGLLLIISCRDEYSLPSNIKSALDIRGINVTRVPVSPLNEKEVIDYVAATLHREKDYVSSLAMVSGLLSIFYSRLIVVRSLELVIRSENHAP
jgi:serine/threonine protein kinase